MNKRLLNFFNLEQQHFHFEVERDAFLIRIRTIFLFAYTGLATLSYIAIIFQSIQHNQSASLIVVLSFCILSLLSNLFFYSKTKNLNRATNVLLGVIFVVIILGVYVRHPLLGGMLWLMPFPLYVFFLKNFKIGSRWLALSFLVFILLAISGIDDFIFINSFVNFIAVYFLVATGILLILFFVDRRQSDLAKYELIAKYSQDVIIFWDTKYKILYASPSAHRYVIEAPEEMIGKSVFQFINQEDSQIILTRKKNSSKKIEFRVKTQKKDQEIWFEGLFEDIKISNNEKVATLMIARDITKRRKYEQDIENAYRYALKFEEAVQNASDHIVITDPDGVVVFANKSVSRITGYSPEEVLGTKAGKLWGGLMGKEFYENFWKTIKDEKKIFEGKIENVRKNKEKYFAYVSVSPILDKVGNLIAFVGIERDITKEVQIDKAKTEFVSLASHQLRTPLSAINWYTEMLLAGDAGKLRTQQRNFVKEIYEGNQRMVKLVNSLLNVSRIELGTFGIEPEKVYIQNIAQTVIGELKPSIKTKKIQFILTIAKAIPKINLDTKLTSIILQNLLSNAIKYTPEKGQVRLTIKKNTTNLLIEVKDTGYGIPEDQQNKIFTKLFRAENVQSKDTEGTGLGLYIVKNILDESGGSITFTSQENKGTIFSVIIPLSGMKAKKGPKGLNSG